MSGKRRHWGRIEVRDEGGPELKSAMGGGVMFFPVEGEDGVVRNVGIAGEERDWEVVIVEEIEGEDDAEAS